MNISFKLMKLVWLRHRRVKKILIFGKVKISEPKHFNVSFCIIIIIRIQKRNVRLFNIDTLFRSKTKILIL